MQFPIGIIYLSNGTLEDKTNINLIETILKNKLFHSTFFIRTFSEKSNFSIDSYYSVLKKIIEEKYKNQNFIDIVKRKIKLEVNKNMISKFSNDSYKNYQDQLQQFKSFNFDFNNPEELYGHLKNDFIKIDEKVFNEFIPEEKQLKQIKQKLELNYNDEKYVSQNICKLYIFISNNTEKFPNYKESFAKEFFEKFNKFIDTTKKNYYKTLFEIYLNLILNLLKRILDIKKKIFSLEPKLLLKEEIINRRAKIFGFQGNLNYTISKEIEDFQTWNKENVIAPLKKLCGSNEFNDKYKELDEILIVELRHHILVLYQEVFHLS